jgi:hypothetical protein
MMKTFTTSAASREGEWLAPERAPVASLIFEQPNLRASIAGFNLRFKRSEFLRGRTQPK